MSKTGSRVRFALIALAVGGCLSFGAAQALGTHVMVNGKCVSPESGCPCWPGCLYGKEGNRCCDAL